MVLPYGYLYTTTSLFVRISELGVQEFKNRYYSYQYF